MKEFLRNDAGLVCVTTDLTSELTLNLCSILMTSVHAELRKEIKKTFLIEKYIETHEIRVNSGRSALTFLINVIFVSSFLLSSSAVDCASENQTKVQR